MSMKKYDHDIALKSGADPQLIPYIQKWRTAEGLIGINSDVAYPFRCSWYNGSTYTYDMTGHIDIIHLDGQQYVLECKDGGGLNRFFFRYFLQTPTTDGEYSFWFTVDTIHDYGNITITLANDLTASKFYITWNHQVNEWQYRTGAGYFTIVGLPEPVANVLQHYKFTFSGSTCTLTVDNVDYNIPMFNGLSTDPVEYANIYSRSHASAPVYSFFLNGFYLGPNAYGYKNVPFDKTVSGCIGDDGSLEEYIGDDLCANTPWVRYGLPTGKVQVMVREQDMYRCVRINAGGSHPQWDACEFDIPPATSVDYEVWIYMTGSSTDSWQFAIFDAATGNRTGFYGQIGSSTLYYYTGSNNADTLIPKDTLVHIRVQYVGGVSCKFWINGVLIRTDVPSNISLSKFRVGCEQTGVLYFVGLGIDGLNGYKIGDNWNLKGTVLAEKFFESSAILPQTSIDKYDDIDLDEIHHRQFPIEVQHKGGLSLGHQIRWLQQNIQESNNFYLMYIDSLRERLINQRKRLEVL